MIESLADLESINFQQWTATMAWTRMSLDEDTAL